MTRPWCDSIPETSQRQLDLLRWGLVPSWAKDIKVGSKLINARAETMATKPAFKAAFAKGRRGIVPANGFFEWQKLGERKQPMFITLNRARRWGWLTPTLRPGDLIIMDNLGSHKGRLV